MESKQNKGITLIVLVITVIILLILAGITINAITGNNGIIGNAGQAKEEAKIDNEKGILEKAIIQAMGNNKYGNIVEDELQEQLDRETGEGKTETIDVGNEFEVAFKESNRYYIVDKDGNIGAAQEIIEDKNPGDITKDKNGNTLKGDATEPYEIWCIEDLIEWSNNYATYETRSITLCKDLNFKSKFSYTDSSRTDYGDFNCAGKIESLMEEMQSGNGFVPIARFSGIFEGNNNILENIYINQSKVYAGLFSTINSNAIIRNVSISGIISNRENYAGAIAGCISFTGSGGRIENCHNYSQISGPNHIGGIVGYIIGSSKLDKIINCSNEGDIRSTRTTENYDNYIGGIVGNTDSTTLTIENCFNKGEVQGSGIAGNNRSYIKNCYNIGQVKYGLVERNQAKIANCYSIGNSSSKYLVNHNYYTNSYMYHCNYLEGTADDIAKANNENSIDMTSCMRMESTEMQEESFVNRLNQNLEGVVDVWVKDTRNINNGYPILIWQNIE